MQASKNLYTIWCETLAVKNIGDSGKSIIDLPNFFLPMFYKFVKLIISHMIHRSSWFNTGFVQTWLLVVLVFSLKYFRPVGSSSSSTTQTLPDPESPLNERVPLNWLLLKWNNPKNRWATWMKTTVFILTPSQCCEVGRQALEHG